MDRPKCLICKHYFSTFDPKRPRGCRIYNSKSTAFPSIIVKQETGQECLSYEEKIKKKKSIDLRKKEFW